MPLILHQFAISHFCEKIRWALDYKGIKYQLRSHVPGLHAKPVKRLSAQTQVPVLEYEKGLAIHGSANIIDWLDENYAEKPLTPVDPEHAAQARDWEHIMDQQLGPDVRRVCYDTLLNHKAISVALLGAGTHWYGKPFLSMIYSKLVPMTRKGLQINEEAIKASRLNIVSTISDLAAARNEQGYLVGNSFTRADLTAAALLAGLTMEPKFGVPWPKTMPDPLGEFCLSLADELAWVSELYTKHR